MTDDTDPSPTGPTGADGTPPPAAEQAPQDRPASPVDAVHDDAAAVAAEARAASELIAAALKAKDG